MSEILLFHMWRQHRDLLISEHQFYIAQAKKRLLSQFDDIEKESNYASQQWLNENSLRFDPDRHNEGDFYEAANEAGIDFYQMLNDMRDRTRLSVVAGMFHEWDKKLRDWVSSEVRKWPIVIGEKVKNKIWSINFEDLLTLLAGLGWNLKETDYYRKLDACRLVVNVYKHGEGNALRDIKAKYPEYISGTFLSSVDESLGLDFTDHTNLFVSEVQIDEFSEAIISFWKGIPEHIFAMDSLSVPNWLIKAIKESQK